MEHYFRTAIWMLFLIGCFQAAPISNTNIKEDINFELLLKDVKFEGNVTFKFPKDVSNSCLGEAVNTIMKELDYATKHATSKSGRQRCEAAIEVLISLPLPHNDSSDCKMQEEGSLNFEDFLKKFESIIESITYNSN